jgi:hypothetical protein
MTRIAATITLTIAAALLIGVGASGCSPAEEVLEVEPGAAVSGTGSGTDGADGAGVPASPTVVERGQAEEPGQALQDASAPEAPQPRTSPVAMGSPEYGVQAFLWWRPELAERDMLLVKDMGFRWIKQGFGWRDIELEKGKFDWEHTDHIVETAMRYGDLELVARVDHQPEWARAGCSLQGPPTDMNDFADFLTALATRYRGRIAAYQIWNEPNLAREWCDQPPDPVAYAQMLQTAYAAVKAADPTAQVISAGLAPTGTQPPTAMPDDTYLDGLYQAMGSSPDGYFDILGVHAPGFAAPPETTPEEAAASEAYGGERYFTFRRVEDLRAIQESHGDGDTPVAILEMGWTSDPVHPEYAWHAVSEETKADYLVRAYQFAAANWSPWVTVMTTIYVCNPDWTEADEQYWWCITNPDGTPRPAFDALKAMDKVQR